jgi:hypothetical protein
MTPPLATADRSAGTAELPSGTMGAERKRWIEQAALVAFIAVPFVAILLAIPVAWGGWLSWTDVILSFLFYALAGHGITVGFHRYLTHGPSRRSAHCASGSRPRAAWPSKAPRSAGSPTTASITSSATRTATRTHRGATARAFPR